MIKGKTKSGFEFAIEDEALDNMELLDALADVDGGNVVSISKASFLLLGNEQRKALYDHVRGDKGNVPIETFTEELADIMNEVGKKGKNS